jgi:hypothetical protein
MVLLGDGRELGDGWLSALARAPPVATRGIAALKG